MALQFRGKYRLSSSGTIACVAFSTKGDYIATGSLDGKLQIFSMADGQLHYPLLAPSPIKSLIWLSGPELMLVCACNCGMIINVTILVGVSNYPCSDLESSRPATLGYHEVHLFPGR